MSRRHGTLAALLLPALLLLLGWASAVLADAPARQQVLLANEDLPKQDTASPLHPYAGHKLLRLPLPSHGAVRRKLVKTVVEEMGLDVWAIRRESMDICVTPDVYPTLLSHLTNATRSNPHLHPLAPPKTLIGDLQALVNRERRDRHARELRRTRRLEAEAKLGATPSPLWATKDWFTDYHRPDEVREWFKSLAEGFPELVTFVPSIGKTFLGEDIFALYVGSKVNETVKPQLWFHSGDHAREWIGPATVQFFVHTLVTKYGKDAVATRTLDSAQLIVVPMMNIDGIKYTWGGSRLWRKNRRPIKKDIFGSVGVDLNRNWPAHWGEGGSSTSPYSDVYMGPSAGSEPEVQVLMKFFTNDKHKRLVGGIDFHSYSQLVLRPYGWTEDPAPDETLLKKVGDGIRDKIKGVHGKKYTSQREVDLYTASGTASDWFYDEDVQKWLPDRRLYAYTIELRPSPEETWGNQGFILPPDQIIPTGEEIYEAVVYFIEQAVKTPLLVK
ncbi:hypothetical protein HDU96_006624 [Phlyctochytrium bullatum]|nr:hypothetical protein HDU96_006624 [Phlyctochytrium bullatum]